MSTVTAACIRVLRSRLFPRYSRTAVHLFPRYSSSDVEAKSAGEIQPDRVKGGSTEPEKTSEEEDDFFGIKEDDGCLYMHERFQGSPDLFAKYEQLKRQADSEKVYLTNFGKIRLDAENLPSIDQGYENRSPSPRQPPPKTRQHLREQVRTTDVGTEKNVNNARHDPSFQITSEKPEKVTRSKIKLTNRQKDVPASSETHSSSVRDTYKHNKSSTELPIIHQPVQPRLSCDSIKTQSFPSAYSDEMRFPDDFQDELPEVVVTANEYPPSIPSNYIEEEYFQDELKPSNGRVEMSLTINADNTTEKLKGNMEDGGKMEASPLSYSTRATEKKTEKKNLTMQETLREVQEDDLSKFRKPPAQNIQSSYIDEVYFPTYVKNEPIDDSVNEDLSTVSTNYIEEQYFSNKLEQSNERIDLPLNVMAEYDFIQMANKLKENLENPSVKPVEKKTKQKNISMQKTPKEVQEDDLFSFENPTTESSSSSYEDEMLFPKYVQDEAAEVVGHVTEDTPSVCTKHHLSSSSSSVEATEKKTIKKKISKQKTLNEVQEDDLMPEGASYSPKMEETSDDRNWKPKLHFKIVPDVTPEDHLESVTYKFKAEETSNKHATHPKKVAKSAHKAALKLEIARSKTEETTDQSSTPKTALDYVQIKREEKKKKASGPAQQQKMPNVPGTGAEMLVNSGKPVRRTVDFNDMTEDEVYQLLKDSIIYNDNGIVAINKPYGIACQPGAKQTQHIQKYIPRLAKFVNTEALEPELYTVHRIDVGTSGILVLAKDQKTAHILKAYFKERKILKTYWAITKGIPDPSEGIIDIPIAEGKIDNRVRMVLKPDIDDELKPHLKQSKVKTYEAVTEYHVMTTCGRAALVQLIPKTGVTHQLRVHLGFGLNCPVLGDHKYSYVNKLVPQRLPQDMLSKLNIRQTKVRDLPIHLHARSITIPEIADGKNVFISAPLPNHFQWAMRKLKLTKQ